MRDYREKTVQGMMFMEDAPMPIRADVDVRMTSDDTGKTLSLTAMGVLIAIPLESVKDIVVVAKGKTK